jgi:hypothetical protein
MYLGKRKRMSDHLIYKAYEGYPKVPGLAAWSENCKWYISVPLGAVVSLFCES